jgi:HAMP domain-containing protein
MRANTLQERLHEIKSRSQIVSVLASVGWAIAGALAMLVLCAWADLVLDLPAAVRAGLLVACVALGLFIVGRLAWVARSQTSTMSLARRLDASVSARGQVVSGVDLLLRRPGNASALTIGLARLAIDRAATLADKVSLESIAPWRPVMSAFLSLGIVGLTTAVIALAMPRLAHAQWARLTDPFGDHPPYSRFQLEVDPGNARVVYGSSLDVRVTVVDAAAELDSLNLVLADAAGQDESLPMFPEGGGKWRATVANITAPARYFARSGSARTEHFQIDVITVPRIESVRFLMTPPAYTHRPPIEGRLPQAPLAGLSGTIVQIWAKSNRPLGGGSVQLDPPQQLGATPLVAPSTQPALGAKLDLSPADRSADEVKGHFVIRASGRLNLGVTDSQGQPSTEGVAAPITLLHDDKPFVRITEPQPESFATPTVTLNVQMLAEDDYGISRLQLFRQLDESRARPTDIPVDSRQPTRLPASVALPLADYGLAPGNVVKLYARVEDNDPAGAKGSESPIVTVHIISEQQMQEMMIARDGLETLLSKYEQASRRMEAATQKLDDLIKKLNAADASKPVDPQMQEEIRKLAQQVGRDSAELKKLSDQDLPFDIDQALKKYLQESADAMRQASQDIRKAASGAPMPPNGQASKDLDDVRKKLGGARDVFVHGAQEPLDYLSHVYPLIEDQQRFVDLYQRQRDLAGRMQSLIGQDQKDDPALKARMRDLEQEQQGLREQLKSLLDDIDAHADLIPPEPRLEDLRNSAKEFAAAVRKSTASDQMNSAQSALEEFAGGAAHEAAQGAADTLEQFISKCQSVGQQGKAAMHFQPSLSQGIGNTVDQLLGSQGLKSAGAGQGGYSMRSNSLRNVGLYGSIPLRGQESARAGGGHAQRGIGDRSPAGEAQPGAGSGSGEDRLRASGQSDAAVPPEYRRRVNDYFQRVADELDDSKDHQHQ